MALERGISQPPPVDFRALLDAVTHGIVAVDSRGAIASWNLAAKTLFGYGATAPAGGSLAELFPDGVDGAPDGVPAQRTGRRRDGTRFVAEVTLSSMTANGERTMVATVRDVTAQQEADDALRRSEALYRRIIETTHEGVCIADADYRYTFVNRRLADMLGYEPGELIGMTVFDLMDEAGGVAQRARIERRRQGKPETGELGLRRKDGTEVWVMFESHAIVDDGRFAGVLSMLMDITERRRIEARLALSEARLREAQQIAHLGSWSWEPGTNVVVRSEEYQRILGLDVTEVETPGLPAPDLIHPEDRARFIESRDRAFREQTPWSCDYRIVRKDSVRSVHARAAVVRDAAGAPIRMLGTVQDVTEKVEAASRAMLTERLVSVGTLALGVAHEINNPLAYVSANLELIAEEARRLASIVPPAALRELDDLVHEARDGADRVRRIVRGLKTFARGDADQPVALDPRRVLDVAARLVANEVRQRARLVTDYGDVPLVVADEGRLTQVFMNLLVNAAQCFGDGPAESHEVCVATRTLADGRACVEVRDTGPGIPADVIGRIFDPFFTTKPVGVGTGLGLAICHGIVTGLGGEITAASDARGSVFRVALPAAREVSVADAVRARSIVPGPVDPARVLIVDDDALVGKSLSRVLGGHETAVVTSGREALELMRTGRPFDVILCDLMMPMMTGMDLHRALGAELPRLVERMVFVTGGAFTPSARAFLDDVPNERIEKPFDVRNLKAIIQRVVSARGRATP